MPTLKVLLDPSERAALAALSSRERRDPRQQAAIIIRVELERRGLLPVTAGGFVLPGPVGPGSGEEVRA